MTRIKESLRLMLVSTSWLLRSREGDERCVRAGVAARAKALRQIDAAQQRVLAHLAAALAERHLPRNLTRVRAASAPIAA